MKIGKEKNNSFVIAALVGIVAIVGLVVLMRSGGSTISTQPVVLKETAPLNNVNDNFQGQTESGEDNIGGEAFRNSVIGYGSFKVVGTRSWNVEFCSSSVAGGNYDPFSAGTVAYRFPMQNNNQKVSDYCAQRGNYNLVEYSCETDSTVDTRYRLKQTWGFCSEGCENGACMR